MSQSFPLTSATALLFIASSDICLAHSKGVDMPLFIIIVQSWGAPKNLTSIFSNLAINCRCLVFSLSKSWPALLPASGTAVGEHWERKLGCCSAMVSTIEAKDDIGLDQPAKWWPFLRKDPPRKVDKARETTWARMFPMTTIIPEKSEKQEHQSLKSQVKW